MKHLSRDLSREIVWKEDEPLGQCQLWIIHDKPNDYPNEFLARKWVYQANSYAPTETIVKAGSLQMVRERMRSKGLKRIVNPGDECDRSAKIIEYWTDVYKIADAHNSQTGEAYEYDDAISE